MGKYNIFLLVSLILAVLSLNLVLATDGLDVDRVHRLTFGHVLYINNITTNPEQLTLGQPGEINFIIENTADQFLRDLRIQLELPVELAPYQSLNQFKIAEMLSGDTANVSFKIISLPTAEEGIYKINIVSDYLNYIGEERQDNQTISILVASTPKIFAEIRSTEVYRGNSIGDVRIKIVNNNVANLKYLTAELQETENFEIIGPTKDYIGDLDSDDFSEVTFRIKALTNKEITLPLLLTYKNSLNQDFSETINLSLKLFSAKELGVPQNNSWIIVVVLVIIGGIWYYRRYQRIKKEKKKLIFR